MIVLQSTERTERLTYGGLRYYFRGTTEQRADRFSLSQHESLKQRVYHVLLPDKDNQGFDSNKQCFFCGTVRFFISHEIP